MEKLRACPLCGNPNVRIAAYAENGVERYMVKYAVLCDWRDGGCGCESGHYTSREEAVTRWNERRRVWRNGQ